MSQSDKSLTGKEARQKFAEVVACPRHLPEAERLKALETFLEGQAKNAPADAAETQALAKSRSTSIPDHPWPAKFPTVLGHTSIATLKAHPDYQSAKAGDTRTARRVIKTLIKPERVATLVARFPDAVVVPVLEKESRGNNKLPLAYANALARAGLQTTNSI